MDGRTNEWMDKPIPIAIFNPPPPPSPQTLLVGKKNGFPIQILLQIFLKLAWPYVNIVVYMFCVKQLSFS